MKNKLIIPVLSSAMAAWSSVAAARQIVVLPGVVGPVGVTSGVDAQGPGTLTVGSQDINTGNDAGGAITTDAANTANVVFTGTSNVTGFVGKIGTTFLNIAGGANANTVTFAGPVFATTFSVSGTGTVNFNGGFTSNTGSTMDFAGNGFINVGAGQTVKAAITNSAGANTGTLTLAANSILDGAVGAGSGLKQINVVGGNALITGQVRAQTYNLGTNTLNVAGAFAIPVAGIINTTIFSQSLYGKIVPVGAASIGNALQVNVIVTGPIVNGSSFNIVDATSGTNGSTVTATSNTTRYAFTAAPTTNGLVKITTTQIPLVNVVTPVITPPVVTPGVSPVVTPPVVNPVTPIVIAPVIDALPVNPTTLPVLTAITLLPTASAVADALAQLGPSATGSAAPYVNYSATQYLQDAWASTLENAQEACSDAGQGVDRSDPRRTDASLCRPEDMHARMWMTTFGKFARQGTVKGFEGYDSHVLGAMAAYEAPLSQSTRAGIGLRYAHSALESQTADNHAAASSYQVMAYLGYTPGPWFANAALVYGWDKYTGARHIVFPGVDSTALADYSGHQLTAYGTTGYHFHLGDGRTTLTPIASLQYTSLRTNAYSETNGGAIALNVNAQEYDFVQSSLGAKLSRVTALSGSQFIRPEVHANWHHAFGGEAMTQTASFISGGPAFTSRGLEPNRNAYSLGTGVSLVNGGAWSVEGVYDYQWRSDKFAAHQVMVNVVIPL